MKNKKIIPNVIFILAAAMLVFGVIAICLYMPSQLKMLSEAREQGASEEQISNYFMQQFLPQMMQYVIIILGFLFTLFSAGLITKGLWSEKNAETDVFDIDTPYDENVFDLDELDNNEDEIFDDIGAVENGEDTDKDEFVFDKDGQIIEEKAQEEVIPEGE